MASKTIQKKYKFSLFFFSKKQKIDIANIKIVKIKLFETEKFENVKKIEAIRLITNNDKKKYKNFIVGKLL